MYNTVQQCLPICRISESPRYCLHFVELHEVNLLCIPTSGHLLGVVDYSNPLLTSGRWLHDVQLVSVYCTIIASYRPTL